MDTIKRDNIEIQSLAGKKILFDITYHPSKGKQPLIVFAHGFKGFKDWGHFNLIAEEFAKEGYAFCKLNFSHNGTTPEFPCDFIDLEAFGHNNFTKELLDLDSLFTYTQSEKFQKEFPFIQPSSLYLIGHSKGGSTSIICSHKDKRVTKLISWAAVANIVTRYSFDEIGVWKKEGVQYIFNSRTNQQMPLYYQLAEDVLNHQSDYDIPSIVPQIDIPWLILHGENDETVSIEEAHLLHQKQPKSTLGIIKGGDHTFNGAHPWNKDTLPKETQELVKQTLSFLNKN